MNPSSLKKKFQTKNLFTWLLNILIVIMSLIVLYLFYSFISQQIPEQKQDTNLLIDTTDHIIQIEILNGSDIKGAAKKFTNYLRNYGIDVVDSRNYRTHNLEQTIIIDRVGNKAAALKVARTIGVSEKNILQQINPDYFISLTVIIGKDCIQLKPMM